ncbi:hypothetical protein ACFQFQ_10895 [Sulfitobacter porphyrae]|uniref:Uncharacterized protein n=1 Tax=Sulfitobacter porphyrae TaxID=1246864 RepID=A0ABW2B2S1_9RHOB
MPGGAQQEDFTALDDTEEMIRIAAAIEIQDVALTGGEIAELLSFLDALTDARAAQGALGAPGAVPSGLPMDSQ